MYTNWKIQTPEILKELRWYSVSQLIHYLHQARSFVIAQQWSRRIYPPVVACCKLPAGKEERFPLDCYVCESIGHWHSTLDVIQLNLQSMLDERQPIEKIGSMQIETLQLINDLLKSFERRTDTITRAQFETRYQLTWLDDDFIHGNAAYCKNPFCQYVGYIVSVIHQMIHFIKRIKPRTIKLNVSS